MSAIGLIAAAVAGRNVPIERSARGVHTDGASIYVPSEAVSTSSEVLDAVLCQAALLATQSLAPRRMKRLARSDAMATERYLALEVVRSCAVLDDVLPSRLRSAMTPYADAAGLTASADDSLQRALSRHPIPRPPGWFGELHPRLIARGSFGGQPARPDDQIADALRRRAAEQDNGGEDGNDDDSSSQLARLMSSPIKNPLGDTLLNLLGARRGVGDGSSAGTEISSIGRRTGVGGGRTAVAGAALPPHPDRQPLRGRRYAEWDHRKGRYRDDWSTVAEFDPAPRDAATGPTPVDRALMRELAGLSRGYQAHHRQPQGGDLDLDALVEFRTGVASGFSTEPNVYREDLRTQQDLGILILLDATGSTAEHAGESSLFDTQRRLATALTTALDQLGARVGAFAFYSRGRHDVRFLRCKTFDERWGVGAQRRMFSIEPSGFTRLGAAVRHATHVVETQAGTERRLLVVVGDGIAYDDGYEGRYAVEDSRRAVAEAAAHGVACVGISAAAPPEGQAIWPPEAHRVITDLKELARQSGDLLGPALHLTGRRHTNRSIKGAAS